MNGRGRTDRSGRDAHRTGAPKLARHGREGSRSRRPRVAPWIFIWSALAATAGSVGLGPSPARADGAAVMLAPTQDPSVVPADRERAAVAAMDALGRDGVAVMNPADARTRLEGEPFQECDAVECAHLVARALGTDFAVLVTVWSYRGESTPRSVAISLIDGEQNAFGGEAEIGAGRLEDAVARAVADARRRQRIGRLSVVEVRSTPPGAVVRIDGAPVGRTPYRRMMEPGSYRISVALEGHREATEQLELTRFDERLVEVTLAQGESPAAAAVGHGRRRSRAPVSSRPRDDGPSYLDLGIAAGLVAAAAPLLTSGIVTFARDGDVEEEEATRVEVVDFGLESAVFVGAGVALVGTALFFALAQPLGGDDDDDSGRRTARTAGGERARVDVSVGASHAAIQGRLSF